MTEINNVALYAPIKPPDHPIPSGDRLIARNLLKALQLAGYTVDLASRYICYSKRSHGEILLERKGGAFVEAERLIKAYGALDVAKRPQVWVTYHPYCKAPDWIGPAVSEVLGIPYVTVEAARTRQGGPEDEWGPWRAEAQPRIRAADLHLVFKPSDRAFLKELLGSETRLRDLAPFVDLKALQAPEPVQLPEHWDREVPVIVTAGMMRKGKKDRNFYMLAEILEGIRDNPWNLVIVGGGPEEDNIRAAFSAFQAERLHWTGQVEHGEVLGWMGAGDLFVWPGWKEPIGMVYLEAQSQGVPVVAYESLGVPLVVEDGVTGLLAPEGETGAFQARVRELLADPRRLEGMRAEAKRRVEEQHSLDAAALRLREILTELST